jgi:hypothetical protein
MSTYTTVKAANWRYVELGRIVLIDNEKLATIVEIIDQKRVCTFYKMLIKLKNWGISYLNRY